jgi:hypothetical protein
VFAVLRSLYSRERNKRQAVNRKKREMSGKIEGTKIDARNYIDWYQN